MINIQLNSIDDSVHEKIHKIKSYRLALSIQSDIEQFIHEHYDSGLSLFRFNTFKFNTTLILERYDVNFDFKYEYDKTYDIVKIIIDNNFVLNIKFIPESDYHI